MSLGLVCTTKRRPVACPVVQRTERRHIPAEEYGISSFVYRRRKTASSAFDGRVEWGLLGEVDQGVLVGGQSSTLLRRLVKQGLSSGRPRGAWFAAVQSGSTDPAMLDYLETIWTEEVGDYRQELVFI